MTQAANQEQLLIFDFGSQYAQLIGRRLRDLNVFCRIVRHDLPASRVAELAPRGIIFSGGPASVYEPKAPHCYPAILNLNIPILGICYGMQLVCQALGGKVKPAPAASLAGPSAASPKARPSSPACPPRPRCG